MRSQDRFHYASIAGVGLLSVFAASIWTGTVGAQNNAPTAPAAPASYTQINAFTQWPRRITSGSATLTVYQPQLDQWQGNRLTGRAAVSVQTGATSAPVYGVVWFSARTEVDKEEALVTLNDIRIVRSTLPSDHNYVRTLQQDVGNLVRTVPLEQLEAGLSITQAEQRQTRQPLRNDPPLILYSSRPAVLVLIDGQPVLRPVAGTNLLRVINTPALLLTDQRTGTYYLYLMDRWMQASSLQGAWSVAKSPPQALETARQAATAAQNADLMDDPAPEVKQALDTDVIPTVYVSQTPAELVQTQGQANFVPISGTRLLWAQNSQNSLFLDTRDQTYYLLISGRWYRSRSLADGTWNFVDGRSLPADFKRIPESHPAGDVLPSVPGTMEAQQALIAQSIPQTATVQRSSAHLDVTYDGEPQFAPIQGASLQYAINSGTPVIQVASNAYYACQNGVWFTAASPTGPWILADSVPPEIYAIPTSSPINYVTNAYVYGSTPDEVYVGYTPGYLGAYVEPYGCVVYGSGYHYAPWIGGVWIGSPITYGLGACFDFNLGSGWSLGFGLGYGAFWHPWWGPWWGDWRWRDHVRWTGNWRRDHGDWRWRDSNLNHLNLYHRWPQNTAISRPRFPTRPGYSAGNRAGTGGNNLFAGRDGRVYRQGAKGWEARDGARWNRVPTTGSGPRPRTGGIARPSTGSLATGGLETPGRLNSDRNMRSLGAARTNANPFRVGTGTTGFPGFHPPSTLGTRTNTFSTPPRPAVPTIRATSPGISAPSPRVNTPFPSMGGSFGGFGRRGGGFAPAGGGIRAGGIGGGFGRGRR